MKNRRSVFIFNFFVYSIKIIILFVYTSQNLAPDVAPSSAGSKQPLCMEQYYRIFNVYRLPGQESDSQADTDGRKARIREHIVVIRRAHVSQSSTFAGTYDEMHVGTYVSSQIFSVVVKQNDTWMDSDELSNVLLSLSRSELDWVPMNDRVMLMTSAARNRWAQHREALISGTS